MTPEGRRGGPSARLYDLALWLLPTRMRRKVAPAMRAAFDEGLREARRRRGLAGAFGYAARETLDVARTGLRMRSGTRGWPRGRAGDGIARSVWMDLRFGARGLVRRPTYLVISAGTLALGIGANAAMFAVVDGVVLRPLAYPDADRLVVVFQTLPRLGWRQGPLGLQDYVALRDDGRAFASVGAAAGTQATLMGRGDPRRVHGWRVSGSLFATLGVEPALGRYVLPRDDRPDAEPVAVLSHALWTRAFGADPDVVGASVRLDDRMHTVVGVMPADFPLLGDRDEYWTALALDPAHVDRDTNFLHVIGRLSEGVDLAAAEADAERVFAAGPPPDDGPRTREAFLMSRHEYVVGDVRHQLLVLLGAVGLVLLVACANVAALSLTRGSQRSRELAVRTALGAGRGRLARHLLAESALLALVGGALGAVVAMGLTEALATWGPVDLPRRDALAVDARVLLYLVAATGACAVLFGTAPAVRAATRPPAPSLKDAGAGGGSLRPQAVLAGAQVALATVLLVAAGLLGRSVAALSAVDPGFRPEGVLTAMVPIPDEGPGDALAFLDGLEERLAAHPAVEAVGVSWGLPFVLGEASTRAMREGASLPAEERLRIYVTPVTPGFFEAMGMGLLSGTTLPGSADPSGPSVAVVNQALADALWPGQDPVGRRFLRGGGDEPTETTVVGLVPDVRTTSLGEEPRPYAYLAYAQAPWADQGHVVLRSSGDPLDLVPVLRAAVGELDDEVPVSDVATLASRLGASLARPRFRAALVGGFALLGAVLAMVGVYGLMSLLVERRRREIGVRMALGAARARVRRTVVAHGLRVAGAGLAVGLSAAALLVRVVEAYLFGVPARDPWTYAAVVAGVAAAVLLAVVPPARRASAVDPLYALRSD